MNYFRYFITLCISRHTSSAWCADGEKNPIEIIDD